MGGAVIVDGNDEDVSDEDGSDVSDVGDDMVVEGIAEGVAVLDAVVSVFEGVAAELEDEVFVGVIVGVFVVVVKAEEEIELVLLVSGTLAGEVEPPNTQRVPRGILGPKYVSGRYTTLVDVVSGTPSTPVIVVVDTVSHGGNTCVGAAIRVVYIVFIYNSFQIICESKVSVKKA